MGLGNRKLTVKFIVLVRRIFPLLLRSFIKRIVNKTRFGTIVLQRIAKAEWLGQHDTNFKIGNYDLIIPSNHHIKEIMAREPFRENLLAQAARVLLTQTGDTFIDVGANVGDTAAVVLSNGSQNVRCILIEPSKYYFDYLIKNSTLFANALYLNKFVSNTYPKINIQGELHHWGGTAKLVDSTQQAIPIEDQIDLIELIDESVKLIKIDCDGLDYSILNSSLPRLVRFTPAIYYENEIKNKEQLAEAKNVIENLKILGYKKAIIARNCGTLIYAGLINDSVIDLFNLQLLLHKQGLRSAIYYTDVIVFHSSKQREFAEVLQLVRTSQVQLMN
jgi:FkbM family methyltransferase